MGERLGLVGGVRVCVCVCAEVARHAAPGRPDSNHQALSPPLFHSGNETGLTQRACHVEV